MALIRGAVKRIAEFLLSVAVVNGTCERPITWLMGVSESAHDTTSLAANSLWTRFRSSAVSIDSMAGFGRTEDSMVRRLLKHHSDRYISSIAVRNNILSEQLDAILFREFAATQIFIVGSTSAITDIFQKMTEMDLLSRPGQAFLVCLDCRGIRDLLPLSRNDVTSQIMACCPRTIGTTTEFDIFNLVYDYRIRNFVAERHGHWTGETGFVMDDRISADVAAASVTKTKLGGALLTVLSAQENTPFLKRVNDSHGRPSVGGYTGELLQVLSEMIDFRFEVINSNEMSYGDATHGLIAEFVKKQYDIGLGVFSASVNRISTVDFTAAIADAPTTFVLQRPSKLLGTAWNLCTRPFEAGLWWAVLVLCALSCAALASAVHWSRRMDRLPDCDWMPAVMSVWLMQGDDYFPSMASAKTTITITSFACMILLSIYNSFLVTFLALDTTPLLTSLDQLASSGDRIGVARGVVALDLLRSSTDTSVMRLASRVTATESHQEGLRQACANPRFSQLVSVPVAFDYVARLQSLSLAASRVGHTVQQPANSVETRRCQLYALKEVFVVDRYHLITQKGRALSSILSRGLTRLRESGVMRRLAQNNHVTVSGSGGRTNQDLQTWAFITVTHVAIPIGCLAGGAALALMALLAEILHHRFLIRGQCRRRSATLQPTFTLTASNLRH